jgi:hypothetical protein
MGPLQAQMNFKMDCGTISGKSCDNNKRGNDSLSAGRQTSKTVSRGAYLPFVQLDSSVRRLLS